MKRASSTILIDYRPALLGRAGIARYVRELVLALARLADRPSIRLFGAAWRRPFLGGPPPLELFAPRLPARGLPLLAALGLGADTLAGGAGVFHYTDVVFPPVRRARRVITIHDLVFESDEGESYHAPAFRRAVSRRVARALARADHVIAVSEATRRDLVARHPGLPAISVIPLGTDHVDRLSVDATLPPGFEREPPFFLFVGTLEPRKNLTRLLRAFEIVADRLPHRLVIAGATGWMIADWQARLARSSVRSRIVLAGSVSDSELCGLYRACEALVYPSLQEGFGLPVAEALRLGVPVVTSSGTAMADLFQEALWLADPRREESIAHALELVASDAESRAIRRCRGRELTADLTWERAARATLRVYADSLGSHHG